MKDGKRSDGISPERIRQIRGRMLVTIGVSVVLAYLLGIICLFGRFQANTYINGVNVSHMTAAEAEELYRMTYAGWQLKVHTIEGNEEIIDGDEIEYALSMKPGFGHMVTWQKYFLWPFTPFMHTSIKSTGSAVFNEEKLRRAIEGLSCVSGDEIRDPVDAYIGRTEDGYYELFEADDGNRLNPERTMNAIAEAISSGAMEINLDEAGCYEKAAVYADNEKLQAAFRPIDDFQQTVLHLNMKGGAYEDVTKDAYGFWLDYNMETGEITVNRDKAVAYTEWLSEQYSTYKTKRQFRANAGDIVMVGGSKYDNFGYEMNIEKTADLLYEAVKNGNSGDFECIWDQTGYTRDELGGDFGNTYIEVSLDEQMLWYYLDGECIVATYVVTGLPTESRATPCGCFQVLDLLRDHTMEGSYGWAYASYVIAIMENGICIHDSSWRGEYGGDIWLYDGSHGCVNTPYYQIQKLYENVWDGVPVIIYDRADTMPEVNSEYDG